jgi:hypothetical protein
LRNYAGLIMVKIDFDFDTPHGVFRDALHLPDDHTFTEAEIQAMKEQRRDNWIAVVTAPPAPEPEPEPEPEYIEIDGVRYVRA